MAPVWGPLSEVGEALNTQADSQMKLELQMVGCSVKEKTRCYEGDIGGGESLV